MGLKYGKDKFKLYRMLTGAPICCGTCEYFASPRSEKCTTPKVFYQYMTDEKQMSELLSFCENYKHEK
jgi:hypothetical protein